MDPKNPVSLLIPLIGITLILAAVWLTGGNRRARLDRALVLRRLGEDLPGFEPGEIAIAADGGKALVRSADGAAHAVLFAAGDRIAVRRLEPRAFSVSLERDDLSIDTGDFTHRRFVLSLPGAAARWARLLAPAERAR